MVRVKKKEVKYRKGLDDMKKWNKPLEENANEAKMLDISFLWVKFAGPNFQ